MADRETIIRLSLTVDRLRGQVRDAEEQAAKRRGMLAEAIAQLDAALSTGDGVRGPGDDAREVKQTAAADAAKMHARARALMEHLALRQVASSDPPTNLLLQLAEVPNAARSAPNRPLYIEYAGADPKKSLKENLRDLFRCNPDKSLAMADVALSLNLPQISNDALRQALKRLFDEGVLVRERDGVYMLNPLPPAHVMDETSADGRNTQPASTGTKKEANNRAMNEPSESERVRS